MRRRWLSRRAIGLHAVILVVVPAFLALCVWQLHRALSGNNLSWAYVFEWPFFAGYAVYMWWRFIHEVTVGTDGTAPPPDRSDQPATRSSDTAGDRDAEGEDDELAAYNHYLAELAAHDKRTRPG